MKVKNINGTSDNSCKCDSWLSHWEKFSEKTANLCTAKNCSEKATVGAHVQSSPNDTWYIIPLCAKHNKQATELELCDDYELVAANVSLTCGRTVAK